MKPGRADAMDAHAAGPGVTRCACTRAREAPGSGPLDGSGPTTTRTRLYREGMLVLEDFPVEDIAEHLSDHASVVWLDLCRPTAADFKVIETEFGLHELAVEDAGHERQRPKLDRYSTHSFMSAYTVDAEGHGGGLHTGEIAVFITGQAMITVRKDE